MQLLINEISNSMVEYLLRMLQVHLHNSQRLAFVDVANSWQAP